MRGDANAVAVFSRLAYALDFMKGTLVFPPSIAAERTYGRPMNLTLVKSVYDGTLNGRAINCYTVAEAADDDPSFRSYICPYKAGDLSYTVLGHEADFCFTFAMDGCTFAVGTPTPNGEVIVSHGNAKGNTEGAGDQASRQQDFATDFHRQGVAGVLDPSTYRLSNKHISTTFGVREGGRWAFHSLRYKRVKDTYPFAYEHLGVTKFA
ncbi:hypothetical protein [Roseisolibacter sp. H3M3-2]|uniref:hypothetical protein n=1 Tax=Roseisolibacter sp. H3M3-2 TaxID=3031323 RepID=UPI0023DA9908|nr:hypothetical protein [Roseisolibacter sp. H3M3-2]MDF1505171.1 hypothetical protein [Roseisolibacter sp. H3M3-2]